MYEKKIFHEQVLINRLKRQSPKKSRKVYSYLSHSPHNQINLETQIYSKGYLQLRVERIKRLAEIKMMTDSLQFFKKANPTQQQCQVVKEIKKLIQKLLDIQSSNDHDKKSVKEYISKQNQSPFKQNIDHQSPKQNKFKIEKQENNRLVQSNLKNQSNFNLGVIKKKQQQSYKNQQFQFLPQNDYIGSCQIYLSEFKRFKSNFEFQIKDSKTIFKNNEILLGFGYGLISLILQSQKYQCFKQIKNHIINYNWTALLGQNQEIRQITQDQKQLKGLLLKIINLIIEKKNIDQTIRQFEINTFLGLIFESYAEGLNYQQIGLSKYFQSLAEKFNQLIYLKEEQTHQFTFDKKYSLCLDQNQNELQVYLTQC